MRKPIPTKVSVKSKPQKKRFSISSLLGLEPRFFTQEFQILLLVIFCALSLWHWEWCRMLFENLRWWSTRNLIQKETSFYSEQAMYYRYFKKGVLLPTLADVWNFFTADGRIQYPDVVNPLKQFNVYPELFFALIYRAFPLFEPIDFYVMVVHLLNGLFFGWIFLLAATLSGNIWGGFVATLSFVYNHSQSTRAYWSPSLRESIAMPFFFAQICALTYYFRLKETKSQKKIKVEKDEEFIESNAISSNFVGILLATIFVCTFFFAISWQFAAFALLTQATAFLVMYLLDYIDHKDLITLLLTSGLSVLLVAIAQFGNEMLLNSLYFNIILVSLFIAMFVPKYILVGGTSTSDLGHFIKIVRTGIVAVMVGVVAVMLKLGTAKAFGITDDGHIFDIFRSKFHTYNDSLETFHTTLYLRQKAFQVIDGETMYDVFITLLIPSAFICFFIVFFLLLKKEKSKTIPRALIYNWLQFIATGLMAIMIMRLKAFWFPFCSIMVGVLWSSTARFFFADFFSTWVTKENDNVKKQYHVVMFLIFLIFGMSVVGLANVRQQYVDVKEWNYPDLQNFMDWINKNTPRDAVFAGDMVTMSTITLVTDRIICNHPHYESEEIRNRTFDVYSITTCKRPKVVYEILKKIGVEFLEISQKSCMKGEVFGAECTWDQRFCHTVDSVGRQFFTKIYDCNCPDGFKIYKLK